MKCTFCGCVFDERDAQKGCSGCPLKGNCRNIKCTNCGFEMPEIPKWINKLKAWRNKKNE